MLFPIPRFPKSLSLVTGTNVVILALRLSIVIQTGFAHTHEPQSLVYITLDYLHGESKMWLCLKTSGARFGGKPTQNN